MLAARPRATTAARRPIRGSLLLQVRGLCFFDGRRSFFINSRTTTLPLEVFTSTRDVDDPAPLTAMSALLATVVDKVVGLARFLRAVVRRGGRDRGASLTVVSAPRSRYLRRQAAIHSAHQVAGG